MMERNIIDTAKRADPRWVNNRETITISDNSPPGPAGFTEDVIRLPDDFARCVPRRPYCANELKDGLIIRPAHVALMHKYIQPNSPAAVQWLFFDVDRQDAYFAAEDGNVATPNYIIRNPLNLHAHIGYLLTVPVARHDAARLGPMRYCAAVERGYRRRLEADAGYSGLIIKNPLHPHWHVECRKSEPYALVELDDYLFERDKRCEPWRITTTGLGRNVTVFDEVRAAAYREVREFKSRHGSFEAFHALCLEIAVGCNHQFRNPLNFSEIRAISKSVAKWTWIRFSSSRFSCWQSARGRRGMARRWANHQAASSLQPWLAEGISRATWYRRRRSHEASPS